MCRKNKASRKWEIYLNFMPSRRRRSSLQGHETGAAFPWIPIAIPDPQWPWDCKWKCCLVPGSCVYICIQLSCHCSGLYSNSTKTQLDSTRLMKSHKRQTSGTLNFMSSALPSSFAAPGAGKRVGSRMGNRSRTLSGSRISPGQLPQIWKH